jgi:type IV secretion system protein VirB10
MLAYTTVRSIAANGQATGGLAPQSERSATELREERSDERVLAMMEQIQNGVLTDAAGADTAAPVAPAAALYPAATSAQAFGRGTIGDMRITGGPPIVVRQGKFLDCALVNDLRVDLAESPVLAMVTRNFLSGDGGYVLVPQGAKLLGSAGTVQSAQQVRVYIKFDRVIFPDQRSAYFPIRQVGAVDGAGAIGIAGDVNRHFLLQFGAAIMLGVLDGVGAAVQSANAAREPTARDLVLAQTSSNFAGILGGVLQRYANVVPTIRVAPGTTLKVFFAEDVRMSSYMRSSDLSWMR